MIPMERRYKIILFALILGSFMTALDATIVAVALPTIAHDMGEAGHDTSNISWVLLVYTLMLCCFILLWSKIGSNIGYKKVFIVGILIFTISSLAIGMCGFIPELGLTAIIVLRGVQGLGAGMSMSMSLAMVSSYLPAESRGSCIGAVTLSSSAGTAFGPAIGGILTSVHWSYIFFINVPIGLICLFLCLRYMKVDEELPAERKRLDIVGAVLILITLFSMTYYLNEGGDLGWMSDIGIALLAVMFVGAGLVAWWEQRATDPLISMSMFRNENILKSNLINTLLFMAISGCYLLLPYYLQYVKGMETIEYGFILIANSVGMMVAGPVVGKITDKTGNNRVFVIVGALLAALGFVMMMSFGESTEIWYILITLFVMGAGMGMALVAVTNHAFGFIKKGEDGLLSGLTNTFRQAGSSSGVAILNAIFMTFILTPAAGMTIGEILMPGFRHAFFVAALMSMFAFVIAMSLKQKEDTE